MDEKKIKMGDKDRIEKILKSINLEKMHEIMKRNNESRAYFKENYDKIVKEHAGCIVAVAARKIVSVPFTSDVSEARKNFSFLEREVGEKNMSGAYISYIPKPDEILML